MVRFRVAKYSNQKNSWPTFGNNVVCYKELYLYIGKVSIVDGQHDKKIKISQEISFFAALVGMSLDILVYWLIKGIAGDLFLTCVTFIEDFFYDSKLQCWQSAH